MIKWYIYRETNTERSSRGWNRSFLMTEQRSCNFLLYLSSNAAFMTVTPPPPRDHLSSVRHNAYAVFLRAVCTACVVRTPGSQKDTNPSPLSVGTTYSSNFPELCLPVAPSPATQPAAMHLQPAANCSWRERGCDFYSQCPGLNWSILSNWGLEVNVPFLQEGIVRHQSRWHKSRRSWSKLLHHLQERFRLPKRGSKVPVKRCSVF